jgi:hypothetical protein
LFTPRLGKLASRFTQHVAVPNPQTAEGNTTMNKLLGIVIAGALLPLTAAAQTTTLKFDDLAPATGGLFVTPYQGFDFTRWYWAPDDPPYNAASSPTSISTFDIPGTEVVFEASPVIRSSTPFVFQSAWFSGPALGQVAIELLLDGVRQNVLDYSSNVLTLSSTPQELTSNYAGLVNEIVVWSHQGHYAMDNVTVTISAVPEPSTWLLALAGLAVVGYTARRRGVWR